MTDVKAIVRLRQLCVATPLVPAALLGALAVESGVTLPGDEGLRDSVLMAHLLMCLVGAENVPAHLPLVPLERRLPLVMTKEREVLDELRTVVEPADEKLVVFSFFLKALKRLDVLLGQRADAWRGLGQPDRVRGHVLVHGQSTDEERETALRQFMAPDSNVSCLLITTQTGAYGLDLTAANHGKLLDPWWNPQKEAQPVARLMGSQQTRPLRLRRLILENTFEERVVALANGKRTLLAEMLPAGSVVDMVVGNERVLPDLLKQFFSL